MKIKHSKTRGKITVLAKRMHFSENKSSHRRRDTPGVSLYVWLTGMCVCKVYFNARTSRWRSTRFCLEPSCERVNDTKVSGSEELCAKEYRSRLRLMGVVCVSSSISYRSTSVCTFRAYVSYSQYCKSSLFI